jgi:hypothetical protein
VPCSVARASESSLARTAMGQKASEPSQPEQVVGKQAALARVSCQLRRHIAFDCSYLAEIPTLVPLTRDRTV